ncbi:MAG: patatin family protein [Evtepia sp.]
MKHGLVMEGGAMRGLFTAGVIDVMMEQNIVFDGAVGVSAGAVFGCNYKSHQIGRVLRYNLAFCQDPRYCSMRSRIKTGDLFGADFCYRQIPDELDVFDREAYANSPMDFYVVGTDVRSGRAVYHNCLTGDHEDLDWLRASASMPLASQIVSVGNRNLLDGGIADSIPEIHPGPGLCQKRGHPDPAPGLCQEKEQAHAPDEPGLPPVPQPAGHHGQAP